MKFLPDINVLFPLLVSSHAHRGAALAWFDKVGVREAVLCRLTRLGILRLLSTKAVMGKDVLLPEAAMKALAVLESDERMVFGSEPPDLDARLKRVVTGCVSSPNLWSDAYLTALALEEKLELVSFDRGFSKFTGLRYRQLKP